MPARETLTPGYLDAEYVYTPDFQPREFRITGDYEAVEAMYLADTVKDTRKASGAILGVCMDRSRPIHTMLGRLADMIEKP